MTRSWTACDDVRAALEAEPIEARAALRAVRAVLAGGLPRPVVALRAILRVCGDDRGATARPPA